MKKTIFLTVLICLFAANMTDAQFKPVLGQQTIYYQYDGQAEQKVDLLINGEPTFLTNQSLIVVDKSQNTLWFDKRYKWKALTMHEADSIADMLLLDYYVNNPNDRQYQKSGFRKIKEQPEAYICAYGRTDDVDTAQANEFLEDRALTPKERLALKEGLYAFMPYEVNDICVPGREKNTLFGGFFYLAMQHPSPGQAGGGSGKGGQGMNNDAFASMIDSTLQSYFSKNKPVDYSSVLKCLLDQTKKQTKTTNKLQETINEMIKDTACCRENKEALKRIEKLLAQKDTVLHRAFIEFGFGAQLKVPSDYNEMKFAPDISIGVFPFNGSLRNLGLGASVLFSSFENHIPVNTDPDGYFEGHDFRDKYGDFGDLWGWRANLLYRTNKEQWIFTIGFGQNHYTLAEEIRERNFKLPEGTIIDYTDPRPTDDLVKRTDLAIRTGISKKLSPTINLGVKVDWAWSSNGFEHSVAALQKPKYAYPTTFGPQMAWFTLQIKMFNY